MKRVLAVALPLALAGCGLPPAVTLISYALDGIALLSTGKTVGDHALSVAANQDCAVWRVVDGENMCKKFQPGKKNVLVAAAEAWARGNEIVGMQEPDDVSIDPPMAAYATDPIVVPGFMHGLVDGLDGVIEVPEPFENAPVAFALKYDGPVGLAADPALNDVRPTKPAEKSEGGWSPPAPVTMAAPRKTENAVGGPDGTDARSVFGIEPAAGTPRPIPLTPQADTSVEGRRVLVIGSFANPANAAKTSRAWPDLDPSVVPVRIRGKTFYRVVSAPLSEAALTTQLRRIRAPGVKGAWVAPVCGVGDAAPAAGCSPPRAKLRR